MHAISQTISNVAATSTNYPQSLPYLTNTLETLFRKAETVKAFLGISINQTQINESSEEEKTLKETTMAEEKVVAAARIIESISFRNKSHMNTEDMVCHENRFWTKYYVLVSGIPFIEDYETLLDAFNESLRNQKPGICSEKSKYTAFALDSIPHSKQVPNPETLEFDFFKNRSGFVLKEVSERIWMVVHERCSRIQEYWLEIKHGACEKWSEECNDISFLAQSLGNDLENHVHFINTVFLENHVLDSLRMDILDFSETMSEAHVEGSEEIDFVYTSQEMGFE